jgi:hypothetical protein
VPVKAIPKMGTDSFNPAVKKARWKNKSAPISPKDCNLASLWSRSLQYQEGISTLTPFILLTIISISTILPTGHRDHSSIGKSMTTS